MVTVSYDEKPGIQALAVTTPDRPPVVERHPGHLRDYEYIRLGTVSLLAGLDLHNGRITEIVSDTHNSADFIAFLKKLDAAYAPQQKSGSGVVIVTWYECGPARRGKGNHPGPPLGGARLRREEEP